MVKQNTLRMQPPVSPSPSSIREGIDEVNNSKREKPITSSSGVQSPNVVRPPSASCGGKSARQTYRQRLENNPSYLPTSGEFWGHDDPYLDNNLRGESGWWRDRVRTGRGTGLRKRKKPSGALRELDLPESSFIQAGEAAYCQIM